MGFSYPIVIVHGQLETTTARVILAVKTLVGFLDTCCMGQLIWFYAIEGLRGVRGRFGIGKRVELA
jgi:hypothetical protein